MSVELWPRRFLEASLIVQFDIHDAVANFIIENFSPDGVVIDDDIGDSQVKIIFYIPETGDDSFRQKLVSYINEINPEENHFPDDIKTRITAAEDWESKYRETIVPVTIQNVIIRPPWHEIENTNGIEIVIEPKMAFGTGHHETTKLCIREIIKHFKPGQSFFDLGCGSGILSILAARLGAGKVRGVDIDLAAVENAGDNIKTNQVADKVEIQFGSIEKASSKGYDFLVANILKSTIVSLYKKIHKAVKPSGIIVLSGLQKNDKSEIDAMLDKFDYLKYSINSDGQWIVVTVIKK